MCTQKATKIWRCCELFFPIPSDTKLLLTKNYSEIIILGKLRISRVIPWKCRSFLDILRAQNPSKITKNNSQGIIFVIIPCQRVEGPGCPGRKSPKNGEKLQNSLLFSPTPENGEDCPKKGVNLCDFFSHFRVFFSGISAPAGFPGRPREKQLVTEGVEILAASNTDRRARNTWQRWPHSGYAPRFGT